MMRPVHRYVRFQNSGLDRAADCYVQTPASCQLYPQHPFVPLEEGLTLDVMLFGGAGARRFEVVLLPAACPSILAGVARNQRLLRRPPFAFDTGQSTFNTWHSAYCPNFFAYDWPQMTASMAELKRELLAVVMHPRNVAKLPHLGLV
jgi:hypothetical protein